MEVPCEFVKKLASEGGVRDVSEVLQHLEVILRKKGKRWTSHVF